jgi:predicted TIM-barrel fold metal-dependent hydrolase
MRDPQPHVMSFAEAGVLLSGALDPRRGMKATRASEGFVKRPQRGAGRITPFMLDLPPNHAIYYPVYAKCIELDLPITINTGIPGPPVPGECQHPMHLDKVCLHFPELKLVMAHGADPWWSEACRLMLKYHNLTMMTSAYLPKYFPPSCCAFMNARQAQGDVRVRPSGLIRWTAASPGARARPAPRVLENFLYENASRVFFSKAAR